MRLINTLITFTLLFGITGCKGKERVPKSILSPEKMQVIMEDMMKADQFLSDYVLNRDTLKKREPESIELYDKVFKIHKVSPEKFYKSFSYYQQHPTLLLPMMDSLSKPVEVIEVKSIEPSSEKVPDSSDIPIPGTDTSRGKMKKLLQRN